MKRLKPGVLVGATGAAEILGIVTSSISRLREADRLPEPAVVIEGLSPVWWRSDIEALAADRKPGTPRTLDLVSVSGAAGIIAKRLARAKLDKSQIGRWRRAGKFPAPAYELEAGKTTYPLWWRSEVADFAKAMRRDEVAKRRRAKAAA